MSTTPNKAGPHARVVFLRGLAYAAVSLLCAALAIVSVLCGGAAALP